MKSSISLVEILVILIIAIVICVMFYSPGAKRINPFEQFKNTNTQSDIIDERINSITETKALQQKIEKNLMETNQ